MSHPNLEEMTGAFPIQQFIEHVTSQSFINDNTRQSQIDLEYCRRDPRLPLYCKCATGQRSSTFAADARWTKPWRSLSRSLHMCHVVKNGFLGFIKRRD